MFVRMNEDQALSLLARGGIGRLGCISNDEPYIVPISYYFEDGAVYSHSLAGLKISALRQNPKACLQVDEVESDLEWRSVLAFGRFEEIVKQTERSTILNKLLQRFPLLTPVESAIADDGAPSQVIVYRIRIERITGISEG
jgi:nitroimidazol reductase NimA-like FMN-containing flavoprotein (pyridoxamine 5'-phosphate oxidase superfamily)